MADFCNQCCKHMGFDEGELADLSTEADTKNKLFATALCEGCGPTQVDHLGNCIFHTTDKHDKKYWTRRTTCHTST